MDAWANRLLVKLLCHLALSCMPAIQTAGLGCRDDNGRGVEWFVLSKLPRLPTQSTPKSWLHLGLAYAYITSSNRQLGWTLSSKSIADPESAAGRTLSPLYQSPSNERFYLLYNDEHPDGRTSFTHGHTKGVLSLDRTSGFWLIHSVPKYPPPLTNTSYGYPHTGRMYGQSFLCISVGTNVTADLIGRQLQYHDPFIYDVFLPDWMNAVYPDLATLAHGGHDRVAPFAHQAVFPALDGRAYFVSFAKYTKYGQDLYDSMVAPGLRSGLLVETWPNGPGKLNSSCQSQYEVENVDAIELNFQSKIQFSTHHDHSKWAIAIKKNRPFVCVGDINRMESQKHRAGGTVCFMNLSVWKSYQGIIHQIETCPIS
ncbi:hypothetical protein TCAL_03062 [Tigriopus californicus]|uniref:Uncharacterized protein n=1 Tax=Tigriopus californicus TaxID=6832 RepID=A0A553NTN1_TIGCA|nr:deoxyribonuclease-2-alpha-like [Tigriopus californicus]TRY68785.1 hypothetical protein TCAL_03062 [Tigriopus californicus]|eukprot:TCALIF_03062-PA protein Name:"Similar to Dnase2 Deoxyribonuclease-2-alpha (Mus musculus)" AED:0.08 eAED:0.08 QI:0/-1/0/1/-1/1/1/186/368